MRHALAPIFGLWMLSACSPEPTVVAVPLKPIQYPPECTSPDPAWVELPDADVKLSVAARRERLNKNNYNSVIGKRSVCRKAHNALSPHQ